MAESSVQLNVGTLGALVSTWLDGSSKQHQEVIIQTQTGASDPVSVGSGNPLPVSISAGAVSVTGTVPVSAAANLPVLPASSTPYKLISAASTNATSVKGSAGTVTSIAVGSISTALRYVKLYDKATAPTVGTDIPVHTLLIPGGTTGSGNNPSLPPGGLAFANGIGFAITTGIADTDTGAVGANEVVLNLGYR